MARPAADGAAPQLTLKTSPVHLWTLSAAIRSSLDRDCRKVEDAWAYVLCVTLERVKRHTSPSHMYACTCACTYVHSHGRTHSCTCALTQHYSALQLGQGNPQTMKFQLQL